MATIEQRNNKFYTKEGLDSLINRCKTLIDLFNKNEFPLNENMLGFGKIKIDSLEECYCRVLELVDLTGLQVSLEEENQGDKIVRRLKY